MNLWFPKDLPRLEITKKNKAMFGLFKKKSPVDKLQAQYKTVMKEAFDLSKVNRSAGDAKYAEAEEIQKKIDNLMHNK